MTRRQNIAEEGNAIFQLIIKKKEKGKAIPVRGHGGS
jgi:hypothetical protein